MEAAQVVTNGESETASLAALLAQRPVHEVPLAAGLGVHRAILAVKADLSKLGIGKGDWNKQQEFAFRGIDQVLDKLSPLLVKHGLMILPRVVANVRSESPTRSGGIQFSSIVTVEYQLTAASDGSSVVVQFDGEAKDPGDKATSKALSIAYKYMAFQTFCIPIAGALADPDRDTPEESVPRRLPAPAAERAAEPAPKRGAKRPPSWDEVIAALKASVTLNELQELRPAMMPLVRVREEERDSEGRTPFEREIKELYLKRKAELERGERT